MAPIYRYVTLAVTQRGGIARNIRHLVPFISIAIFSVRYQNIYSTPCRQDAPMLSSTLDHALTEHHTNVGNTYIQHSMQSWPTSYSQSLTFKGIYSLLVFHTHSHTIHNIVYMYKLLSRFCFCYCCKNNLME